MIFRLQQLNAYSAESVSYYYGDRPGLLLL